MVLTLLFKFIIKDLFLNIKISFKSFTIFIKFILYVFISYTNLFIYNDNESLKNILKLLLIIFSNL